jgi:hypothetical protein
MFIAMWKLPNLALMDMFEACQPFCKSVRKWKTQGHSAEQVISLLRAQGAAQIAIIYALKTEYEIPLAEADSLVLHSASWADQLEATLALRKQFKAAMVENQIPDE